MIEGCRHRWRGKTQVPHIKAHLSWQKVWERLGGHRLLGFFPPTQSRRRHIQGLFTWIRFRAEKSACRAQMNATAFEGQGVQSTSRGHSNMLYWIALECFSWYGTGQEEYMQYTTEPGGRLFLLVTLAGQHATQRRTFIQHFLLSLRCMQQHIPSCHAHSLSAQRKSEHCRKRPCHHHYLYSPSLWVMERESTLVWMLNAEVQWNEKGCFFKFTSTLRIRVAKYQRTCRYILMKYSHTCAQ